MDRPASNPHSESERLSFGDGTVLIKISTETTGGVFSVFEELPPLLDTPLHVHAREDELYYVLEGEHIFQRGEEEMRVDAGETIFLPRGVPHAHRRVIPGHGHLLGIVTPGGFEGFFRALAEADREGRLGADAFAAASEHYAITWLGAE